MMTSIKFKQLFIVLFVIIIKLSAHTKTKKYLRFQGSAVLAHKEVAEAYLAENVVTANQDATGGVHEPGVTSGAHVPVTSGEERGLTGLSRDEIDLGSEATHIIATENSLASYDDCTDDESFRYEHVNKKGKSKLKGGCNDFIAKKRKKRCRKRTIDGRKIRDVCPSTCGFCEKKVCSVERFIGVWQYSSPCGGGGVFELTVRCDDKMKKHNKCHVRDRKIIDATDDGDLVDINLDETCVTEGIVNTKDVAYNTVTGNCLLPFVALNGGTCDEISDGFGVKAEIAAGVVSDKKDAVMNIKFSRDEGESYYNDKTPYEGYFVPSDGKGRSLSSNSLNNGDTKCRAPRVLPQDKIEYDDVIDIGGYYKERCDSWNRKNDPNHSKFPTTILPEKENSMLNEGGYCTDRIAIAAVVSDDADASFQRCFIDPDNNQYCWSNSAEYEREIVDGETVSRHIHCHPEPLSGVGGRWIPVQAKKLSMGPEALWCGEQCGGYGIAFATSSNPYHYKEGKPLSPVFTGKSDQTEYWTYCTDAHKI